MFAAPPTETTLKIRPPRAWSRHLWFAGVALAIGAWRLWLCAQAPHDTADILRHLYTALAVLRDGLGALAHPLSALAPSLSSTVPWADYPYNYPIGAVAFFSLVASVHPSVLAAKIFLTGVEAINSILVGRITGSRLAALAYWASPLSLWWVSHEGQFEPAQTLPMLLAWWLLARRPGCAGALLALAVQVKLTALLLLPLGLMQVWRLSTPAALRVFVAGFLIGFAPSVLAATAYPMVAQIFLTSSWPVTFNPWHWAFLQGGHRWWLPVSYVLMVQAALAGAISVMLYGLWKDRRGANAFQWAAPLALAGLAKTAGVFQPWYWLVFTAFLPTLARGRLPVILAILLLAIEPLCTWQLVRHRVGPDNFPNTVSAGQILHLP